MKNIKYLTELKLVIFLLNEIDQNGIHNKQFMKHKFRPDFVSHNHKLVVEFDGYLHYTKAKTILRDYEKDKIILAEGYNIVRIPYFVQLDSKVMNNLFSKYMLNESYDFITYPHGFVDPQAILPADYCSLGVQRFISDLKRFNFISDEIMNSLKKIQKHQDEILPINLTWK